MQEINKKTIILSKEDLQSAVLFWLEHKGVSLGGFDVNNGFNIKISEITKRVPITGLDPHDCDYQNIFDGVKIELEQQKPTNPTKGS